ncbi:MAG: acylphosphatase [Fretibacterium sp.]|nr:acylphosphatase [Fretibacterium sp.]
MAQPVVRRHALLTGRVQGVGFRWRAREKAEHLGLTGWVRNLPDGRVEAVFQGPPDLVGEMEAWLRRGPLGSQVRGAVFYDERIVGGEEAFEAH